ncbi:E3 ubiquitin/ISG15 ligase TRIM25 isoform X1 [Oncorhynchus mykiss]|uniref:E3 ubiquitin/ISG15 ligase TRIM25 isoform X1 n=1 Tax=Oncorhynchus mykiss TaxID=8022 RepID=UPI0018786538|nr:E3 ubiquitin/ISG15 ligase TRIM25 isoform X1 [Oncorhynchus mykiss]
MAENQELFCCSICLDLLKDPVTTACGHSYCVGCIKESWDQDDLKGVYRCPQCRQTFTPRPVLKRNIVLAEVVENLKKTGLQAAPPPALCYAGPGDVACDFCTGTRKQKALMSCLVCLASYCETHLQLHYESRALKKHKLVKATAQLQEKICSHHDKLLEVFCRTDQQCICYQCVMDEHKGHDTVSASAERTEKQQQLGETQKEGKQRAQRKEKEVQELRQAVDAIKESSWVAVDDFERMCSMHILSYIRSIERRCSEVKEQIRAQEKAGVSQAEGLLEQLEQEVAEFKRRDSELEQLSHTEDHIHFLQSIDSLCGPPGPKAFPSSLEAVKKFVSEQKERMENTCKEETDKMLNSLEKKMLTNPSSPPVQEYSTRSGFLKDYRTIEVDPNTACATLSLSNRNKEIAWSDKAQAYSDHLDRFTYYHQALCKVGLSETCYWEVEWSGGIVDVAVSYRGISRKGWGNDCCFGHNDQSWSLVCSPSSCSFWHNNNNKTNIPVPRASRVGVYLDHKAGTLSFYSISNTMALLHRVQTIFTEPLYPGFGVDLGSSLKICHLPV